MKRVALALVAALSACAGSDPGGPTPPGAMVIGDVSDARNRARLHTDLAALYYGRGSMAIALEELRIAVAADPSYGPAHSMFGLVYMQLRETKLAEESFRRALSHSPNDSDINHNFGWFLCQTERAPESIPYFVVAVRNPLYPTPWRSYAAAGVCSQRMKNDKQAEGFFERALRLEPDDPTSLLQLGQIRYQQASFEDARELVGRFNRVVTPTAESLWLAARVERKLGQRVAERNYSTELRRRYPDSPEYQALQRGEFD
ncbi:MAG TPA: type IV pilus biogenesis/stability protein PilW [Burkholderiales bacterium]|nr:type IV pilus biogenesis/stability protein PilW [Burkholderiales bacterium]